MVSTYSGSGYPFVFWGSCFWYVCVCECLCVRACVCVRAYSPPRNSPLDTPQEKLTVERNDDEISASPRNIGTYMIL